MPFTDIELAGHKRTLNAWLEKERPPPHIRPKLDFGYRITKQEKPIAKATWNKRQGVWQVYWQRADLKWHRYEPTRSVATLNAFLKLVREDKHACFFG